MGPGAHAFDGSMRRWNAARLDGYLAALAPRLGGMPVLPPGGSEPVDDAAAAAEAVILGLRLDDGARRATSRTAGRWRRTSPGRWTPGSSSPWTRRPANASASRREGRLLSNELFARLV